MKKFLIFLFISVFFAFPNLYNAKKITCSNADFNATVEVDKDKIRVGEQAFITVNSETENITVTHNIKDNNILNINNDGIINGLIEGKTLITTKIKFSENNSCSVSINMEVVSNDSQLKSLTLEELDISSVFNPNKYEYEVFLPYNFEKINIIAEANNPNAKITGDGRRYLNEGNNEYEIIVNASDGSTSTYKIKINRKEANTETTLDNLIVEGYILSPKFNKDIYEYILNVDKEVDEINISAIPTYQYAKVSGTGKFSLATGKNVFFITVTAENGNEQEYQIIINKNNGSSKLKSLTIKGFKLDTKFKDDNYIYNLTVPDNVTKLDIIATGSEDEQIEILGNDNLKHGSNDIIIRVTGKDKTSTTYKIIVTRLSIEDELNEKNNKLLYILLIIFIIAIIFMVSVITIFIKRNYKRKKNFKIKNQNKRKNKRK